MVRIIAITLWLLTLVGLWMVAAVIIAQAHEATNIQGQPTGWAYPWACCSSQDCSPLRASAVEKRPDGYHITLEKGDHPFVLERVVFDIPYSDKRVRNSPDGDYHICIRGTPLKLLCFFRGPEGF